MPLVRVSPGIYRDTKTGKLVRNNVASPAIPTTPKPGKPAASPGAGKNSPGMGKPNYAAPNARTATPTPPGAGGPTLPQDNTPTNVEGQIPDAGKFVDDTSSTSADDTSSTPAVETPEEKAAREAKQKQMMDLLLGQFNTFTDSPYYNQQVEAINKRNAAWAAARGLTGSGFEAQMTGDDLASLDAAEQTRADELAQARADRLYTMLKDEQERQTRAGNTQFTRLMDLLRIGLDYSNSALDNAYKGISGLNDLEGKKAKDLASYLAQAYQKVYGNLGGGTAAINNLISSPDFSVSDLARAISGASDNTGYAEIFKNFLSGAFS